MNWAKILEPYFADYPPGTRDAIVKQIVAQLPATPTLQTQQAVMQQIPEIVASVRQQIAEQAQAMSANMADQSGINIPQSPPSGSTPLPGPAVIPDELTQVFTRNYCQKSKIVDITPIDGYLNLEIIQGLWSYFRITDPVSLQKYPNIQNVQQDIKSEQIQQYYPLYTKLEKTFSQFISFDRGSLVFITGNDIVFLVKRPLAADNNFEMFQQAGAGQTILMMFGVPANSGVNFVITVNCLN